MARSGMRRLFDNGQVSDKALRRHYGTLCGADEIDTPEYQRSGGPGFGKTTDFGPDDAGHIDAKANRRAFPKESAVRAGNRQTGSSREARIQPSGHMYDLPGRN
jgi:hypothetical protein